MIDEVSFEVDGGYGEEPPYSTKAFLTIEGDFVREFEGYLKEEDATSVSLEITRDVAEKLHKQLTEVLYG